MISETNYWAYWEGPCPPLVQLCIESIRRACNVRVLDRQEFDGMWKHDRDLPIDTLYVAHRADFIRAYLLSHFGGVWIDADCIVLQPIAPLAAHLASHDLVYYREPPGGIANNFFLANPHTPIIMDFYDSVVSYLRKQRPAFWSAIGSRPLTAAIDRHPEAAIALPTAAIMPISWEESTRFLQPVPQEDITRAISGQGTLHDPDAFCYMLCNHSMPSAARSMSREEILTRPTFLNYLFRVAGESSSV